MKIKLILILAAAVTTLTGCHKSEQFESYFYQRTSAERIYILEIDGENRGEMPFVDKAPGCGDSIIQADALHFQLSGGKHTYKMKTADGVEISSGKFRISKNKLSNSGNKGRTDINHCSNEMIVLLGE